jgi:hypothetical protein
MIKGKNYDQQHIKEIPDRLSGSIKEIQRKPFKKIK